MVDDTHRIDLVLQGFREAEQHIATIHLAAGNGLSPMLHPAMGRVPLVFEPKGLGGATGRGAKPST
jgi:hypothetical protein